MTLRDTIATASLAAILLAASPTTADAAAEPTEFGGDIRVVADRVITTVNVPPTDVHEYIARVYMYDVYGTCWNRRSKPLPGREQLLGGGRVPGRSEDYVLRLPPDQQTRFTWEDSLQTLLEPSSGARLRRIACPAGTVAGFSRLHIRELEVHASSFGSRSDAAPSVDHRLPPPASRRPSRQQGDRAIVPS